LRYRANNWIIPTEPFVTKDTYDMLRHVSASWNYWYTICGTGELNRDVMR